jgi:hypothetical protein
MNKHATHSASNARRQRTGAHARTHARTHTRRSCIACSGCIVYVGDVRVRSLSLVETRARPWRPTQRVRSCADRLFRPGVSPGIWRSLSLVETRARPGRPTQRVRSCASRLLRPGVLHPGIWRSLSLVETRALHRRPARKARSCAGSLLLPKVRFGKNGALYLSLRPGLGPGARPRGLGLAPVAASSGNLVRENCALQRISLGPGSARSCAWKSYR